MTPITYYPTLLFIGCFTLSNISANWETSPWPLVNTVMGLALVTLYLIEQLYFRKENN